MLIVTEVDKTSLTKFAIVDGRKKHLMDFKLWKEEEHKVTKDDYQKFSDIIIKYLSSNYGVTCSM